MNNELNEVNWAGVCVLFFGSRKCQNESKRAKNKKKKENQQTLKTEYIKYRSTHSLIHMNIFVYGMPYETNSNMIHCETK